jgi:aldehyde dehydrogenase (NAD+)
MMLNSGQSCNAPSRMLVPNSRIDEAVAVARDTAEKVTVGDPEDSNAIGPVVSKGQFDKIQGLIQKGIDEGATVLAGGPGRPDGLDTGYYVKPTVFADVTNDMTIAREEIFGPVLAVIPYDDTDDAVRIANDSEYGLAGSVWTGDIDQGLDIARRVRTGTYGVNQYTMDFIAPFGGYKGSGLGREFGVEGLSHYVELKSIVPPAGA